MDVYYVLDSDPNSGYMKLRGGGLVFLVHSFRGLSPQLLGNTCLGRTLQLQEHVT